MAWKENIEDWTKNSFTDPQNSTEHNRDLQRKMSIRSAKDAFPT